MVNRVILLLGFSLIFPIFLAKADMAALNQMPSSNTPIAIITPPELIKAHTLEIAQVPLKPVKKQKQRIKLEDLDIDDNDLKRGSVENSNDNGQYAGFLSEVSPEYTIDSGFLYLTKVPYNRSKRSIMFVMLMNGDKHGLQQTKDLDSLHSGPRVHVLWPGSKKIKLQQKLIKDEYPLDISVANYEDGYAAGEWNMVLPYKKPREVKVSLLWVF